MEFFNSQLEPFKNYENKNRFEDLYKQLVKDQKNTLKGQPYSMALSHSRSLMVTNIWSSDLLAEKVDELIYEEFLDFKKTVFKHNR